MEIHQIRYFLSIAEHNSFTAAAEACNVSQPSLSAQLAKLEAELGGPLFERGRHGARLTQGGEVFRPRAAEALRQLEAGRREIAELAGLTRGSVGLGCLPTTGAYLLPGLFRSFRESYPGVQVRLWEDSSPQLAKALHDYEIELAIMDEAGGDDGLEQEVLFREPLVLALPNGHALARSGAVTLAALNGEPFILMKRGHGYRQIVEQALARAGVTPKVVYESDEIGTVQRLVAAGLGVSIVPAMVQSKDGPVYLPIRDPTPVRTLLLAHRESETLSAAATAMRRVALRVLQERSGRGAPEKGGERR